MTDSILRELGVSNDGRIVFDRSRVRILVCDPSTSPDVVDLLRRCSYQVIAVQNARQVMEFFRTGKAQVDLILADVELPMKRGFKMLKYFMKEEQLKQIPIVMMSSRDEMAVVGKCLRLGAADYLVKPLRTNELLNLWTHMWRRRRMLGMTEKHLISGNLNSNDAVDLLFADTSESNTASTDFISDDSNDQARRSVMDGANSRLASTNDEACRDIMDGANTNCQLTGPPGLELTLTRSSDFTATEHNTRSERVPSPPKKTELKIGESSAFLAYPKFCNQQVDKQVDKQQQPRISHGMKDYDHQFVQTHGGSSERVTDWQPRRLPRGGSSDADAHDRSKMVQKHTSPVDLPPVALQADHSTSPWEAMKSVPRGSNINVYMGPEIHGASHGGAGWSEQQLRPRFPPAPAELSMYQMHIQNESLMGVPTIPPFAPTHHLPPNMLAAANMHASALLPPSLHFYCGLDGPMGLSGRIPPIHSLPPGHGLPPPAGYSYYPISVPVGQPAQIWSPMPSIPPSSEHKHEKAERREAALSKFRQKRKDRCFDKKIRYVSRKRLAEQRPRNRGQFMRRSVGLEMCGGGGVDESEDEDEEYENALVGNVGDSFPVNRVMRML